MKRIGGAGCSPNTSSCTVEGGTYSIYVLYYTYEPAINASLDPYVYIAVHTHNRHAAASVYIWHIYMYTLVHVCTCTNDHGPNS